MSLSDLASLGSFVSGLAVVVTLIFLLLQMRQSNLNQRALMQQMRSARTIETLLQQAEPHISETLSRAYRGDPDLDEAQWFTFLQVQYATHYNFEDTFLQHELGVLDEASFESDTLVLRKVFATIPAFRVAWQILGRETFSKNYRQFVDQIIHEAKPSKGPGLASVMPPLVARELDAAEGA